MLDVLLTLCNLIALFVFLYTAAGLAVTGVAEILQLAILGLDKRSEGLQDGEIVWLVVPPLIAGGWLFVMWYLDLGMVAVAL